MLLNILFYNNLHSPSQILDVLVSLKKMYVKISDEKYRVTQKTSKLFDLIAIHRQLKTWHSTSHPLVVITFNIMSCNLKVMMTNSLSANALSNLLFLLIADTWCALSLPLSENKDSFPFLITVWLKQKYCWCNGRKIIIVIKKG